MSDPMGGIALACLFGTATLFVAAGAAKLVGQDPFNNTLVSLGLPATKPALVRGLAVGIPCLELLLGFAAFGSAGSLPVRWGLLVLSALFLVLSVWAWRKRPGITCRCFGSLAGSQFGRSGVVKNCVLVAAAGMALVGFPDAVPPASSHRFDVAMVLIVLALLALAVAQAGHLAVKLDQRSKEQVP